MSRLWSHDDLCVRGNLDKGLGRRWRRSKRGDYDVCGGGRGEMEGQRVLLSVVGSKSGIGKGTDLGEKVHLEEAGMQLDDCPKWY